jgi:hypothetical protein
MEENLQTALSMLSEEVRKYRASTLSGDELNVSLQQIAGLLFYLTEEKVKYHKLYQASVFSLVKEGCSVAKAENESGVIYPEYYQLDKVCKIGERCFDAIRSNLSWLKQDINKH